MIRISRDIIDKKLNDKDIHIIGEYHGTHKKSLMKCINGHFWTARVNNVILRGCPTCNSHLNGGHHLYSKLTKEIVNNRINFRNIYMIGDYINQDTKTQFECDYGHRWSSTPDSVMRISGCPKCAKYGYKETLPGWVYVLKFENFIKFGITNNLKSRLYRHLLNNGKYELIITKCYATGKEARLVENLIKTLTKEGYATKEQCPDGFTETLSLDMLSNVIQIINEQLQP
jgi:hypothetical protein